MLIFEKDKKGVVIFTKEMQKILENEETIQIEIPPICD
jgi:hypothetical protein